MKMIICTTGMAPCKKKLVKRPFFNIINQYHTAVVEIIIVILVSESTEMDVLSIGHIITI